MFWFIVIGEVKSIFFISIANRYSDSFMKYHCNYLKFKVNLYLVINLNAVLLHQNLKKLKWLRIEHLQ